MNEPRLYPTVRPRDTYRYQFKVGNKVVCAGTTSDLERREAEHRRRWPGGNIVQVGRKTTKQAARSWEKEKGY